MSHLSFSSSYRHTSFDPKVGYRRSLKVNHLSFMSMMRIKSCEDPVTPVKSLFDPFSILITSSH